MLENIRDVGAAGGVWFQWEDGWWKNAWTTRGRAFPESRFPLWHDRLNPEQAFGLLAFEPEPVDALDPRRSPEDHRDRRIDHRRGRAGGRDRRRADRETRAYAWPTWDEAPRVTERLKDGAETLFEYTRALPRWLD